MNSNAKLIIKKVNLHNFATFDDQSISFSKNFSAIIGETGSGKSLILDSLHLILGARADRKLIRKDSEYATVEAVFECFHTEAKNFFDEIGFPFENNEIVIKRILYPNGKSKSFLNFQTCNLTTLQSFAKTFIDIVGQFENQKLLTNSYQLLLLDNYCNNQKLVKKYDLHYSELQECLDKINSVKEQQATQAQRLDYIDYQVKELDLLSPSIEDEEQLISKKEKIMNIENLNLFIQNVDHIFDSESGLSTLLSKLEKEISTSTKFTDQQISDKFYQAKDLLNEIYFEINSKNDIDYDEEELNKVLDHLDSYQRLKRKFGTDTQGLIKIYHDFQQERELLKENNSRLIELETKKENLHIKCLDLAEQLHTKRLKGSKKLSNELTKVIQSLNMKGASIKIDSTRIKDINSKGCSEISFRAETNPGEGFHKVKDIASGGELSRILLALRQLVSSKDSISIFFFDEIDSGIGGETALKIGNALKEVSLNSQVIAITHLPQIANYSDQLIIVKKEIQEIEGQKRTSSSVLEVNDQNIKSHIERMTPLN